MHSAFKVTRNEVDCLGKIVCVTILHYAHCDLTDMEYDSIGEGIREAISEETEPQMKSYIEVGLKEYNWRKADSEFYKTADSKVEVEQEDSPAAAEVRKIKREWRQADRDWTADYWESKNGNSI